MADYISINELSEWEYNSKFRGITQKGIDRLDKNSQFGQHTTLLVYFSPDGQKIAVGGNNRLKRWKNDVNFQEVAYIKLEFGQDDLGYYPILDGRTYRKTDGTIPHHFRTIEEGMLQLALSHNVKAAYDLEDEVANMIGNFPDIDWSMYTGEFIDPIDIESIKQKIAPEDIIEDEIPELSPEEPRSVLGSVYQVGRHRLMCGDATKIEDVEKLMNGQKADMVLTDPPYNTGMQEKKNDQADWLGHMFNDSYTPEQFLELIDTSLVNMVAVTKGDATFYVCIDWRRMGFIKERMEQLLKVGNVIVWDKIVHGLGSDYQFTYEMIIVGKKGAPEIRNRINDEYRDIWHFQREVGRNENHATAKPLGLLAKPLNHASKQDDIVLDLFGGSGSTLIACEQTNRVCHMMELDPKYIDVIRKRYAKFIGREDEWEALTPEIQ